MKRALLLFALLVPLFSFCTLHSRMVRTSSQMSAGLDFYFAQISDTHLPDSVNQVRLDSVFQFMAQLPHQPVLVLITGDMLQNPADSLREQQSRNAFSGLHLPTVFTPGNHDIGYAPDSSSFFIYEKIFGRADTTFVMAGIRWIGMNSCWMVDSAQKKCDSILQVFSFSLQRDTLPKIIFTHIPPADNFYKMQKQISWSSNHVDRLDSLLRLSRANAKALITGHFHRDEIHWIAGVPVYVSAPVARSLGRQAQFRLYHYQNGKIEYFSIFLE